MTTPISPLSVPDIDISGRQERIRVDLLDEGDRIIGELGGISGASIDMNVSADIRVSGGIRLTEVPDSSFLTVKDVDFGKHRIRIHWIEEDTFGTVKEWPVGTFLITAPDREADQFGSQFQISLLDKTIILQQHGISTTFSVSAGESVTSTMEILFGMAGETSFVIQESAASFPTSMAWTAGTSLLRIINDLADLIGYFGVWCDGNGTFQLLPYVRPAARPIAFDFKSGETSIHLPTWKNTVNMFDVPNRVVLRSQPGEEDVELEASWDNTDPLSPFSITNRGKVITHLEEGVEATDLLILQEMARRRLIELSTASSTFSVSHAMIPLRLNDRIRFTSHGETITAIVQTMSVTLETGALVQATWREVQDL